MVAAAHSKHDHKAIAGRSKCDSSSDAGTQCEERSAMQSFASKAPLLVCTTGSVAAFSNALRAQRGRTAGDGNDAAGSSSMSAVQRFRANLVFDCERGRNGACNDSGAEDAEQACAHIEDQWDALVFHSIASVDGAADGSCPAGPAMTCGGLVLQARCPAARCTAINAVDKASSAATSSNALRALASYRQAKAGLTWGMYMQPVLPD